MAQYIRTISNRSKVELFLNGGVAGGKDLRQSSKLLFLHGKTLVFTGAYAGTVTFNAGAGSTEQTPMTLKDIVSQIVSQSASALDVSVSTDGRLTFLDAGVPTTAVAITGASTALELLGFDGTGIAGKFYNSSGGATPKLLTLSTSPVNSDVYLLLLEE